MSDCASMKTNRVQREMEREKARNKYEATRKERALHKTTADWETTGRVYRFMETLSCSLKFSVTIFLNIIIAHSCFSLHSLSASCASGIFPSFYCFKHSEAICLQCIESIFTRTWRMFRWVLHATWGDVSTNFECFFEHSFHCSKRTMGKSYELTERKL